MRRLASALVLAALTFTLLLAGTGAAAADSEAGPLDGSFGVPPSRPGDRGVYALNLVVDMGEMMDALVGMYGDEMDAEDQAEMEEMEGLSGTQVIDAQARWEVERLPDRLLPLPGGLEPVASFASAWGSDAFDWTGSAWSSSSSYGYNPCAEDPEECSGDGFGGSASYSSSFGGDEIAGEPWHVVHVDASHSVVATTRVEADPSLPGALLSKDLGLDPGLTVVTRPGPGTAPCGFHSTLQDGPQPLS